MAKQVEAQKSVAKSEVAPNMAVPAAAAPVAAAAASTNAADSTKDKEKAKRKPARKLIVHPAFFDEKGVERPIDEAPADWDERKHKPICKRHLKDEVKWYKWMADFHGKHEKAFRAKAEMAAKIGNSEQRKAFADVQKALARVAHLREVLTAQGSGVSAEDMMSVLAAGGVDTSLIAALLKPTEAPTEKSAEATKASK